MNVRAATPPTSNLLGASIMFMPDLSVYAMRKVLMD